MKKALKRKSLHLVICSYQNDFFFYYFYSKTTFIKMVIGVKRKIDDAVVNKDVHDL